MLKVLSDSFRSRYLWHKTVWWLERNWIWEGYSTHRVYLREFSANFYVLNLCLQVFSIAFERAIKDEERYSGCRKIE
jgi:hypothetical protein